MTLKKLFLVILILCVTTPNINRARWFEFEEEDTFRIISVGDVMLGRGVKKELTKNDNSNLLRDVSDILNKGDITICNLESPVVMEGKPMDKKYIFKADTTVLPRLKKAGFNCVTVANNHAFDFGTQAFLRSMDYLHEEGIRVVGGGKNLSEAISPLTFYIRNLNIGIMGLNDTKTNFIGKNKPAAAPGANCVSVEAVQKYASQYDFFIIHIHWGREYEMYPTDRQTSFAHTLVRAGADLIIGHHPHHLQGIEIYKNSVIAYSLGNFIFDQDFYLCNLTAILNIKYRSGYPEEVLLHPVENISNWHHPRLASGFYFRKIKKILTKASKPFGTEFHVNDSTIHVQLK